MEKSNKEDDGSNDENNGSNQEETAEQSAQKIQQFHNYKFTIAPDEGPQ